MTGLELLKAPGTTAGEIADIISEHCPPVVPTNCDRLSCRECWLAWLTTGEPPKAKGPSDKQTAPEEDGMHPNLVEHIRRRKMVWDMTCKMLDAITPPGLSTSAPPPPDMQRARL